jgi:hypothetical protein
VDSIVDDHSRFWAHCSNLQVWVENDYDTCLLHSNISFPLLKELQNLGDRIAKKVFKEEIAKRLMSGEVTVAIFLMKEGYLNFLSQDEIDSIFKSPSLKLFSNIFRVFKNSYSMVNYDFFCDVLFFYEIYGKYFYFSLKEKLKEVYRCQNAEDLIIIITSQMWDYLKEDDFLDLLDSYLIEGILNAFANLIDFTQLYEFISYNPSFSIFSENIDAFARGDIRVQILNLIKAIDLPLMIVLFKLRLFNYLDEDDIKNFTIENYELIQKVIFNIEDEKDPFNYGLVDKFLELLA